jgi:hypothetical protein
MFAHERDIVQSGYCSMELVIELILGEKLDKSDDVRCSKWVVELSVFEAAETLRWFGCHQAIGGIQKAFPVAGSISAD